MAIFTINRNARGAFGTGLPIYKALRYQDRRGALPYTPSPIGYWLVPSNKLPVTQFDRERDIIEVALVPVIDGQDAAPIVLPLSTVVQESTTSGLNFAYITDDDRPFILNGLYYYRFKLDSPTDLFLYSELFNAGGICGVVASLGFEVLQVNGDLSANVRFNFEVTAAVTVLAATVTILGTPYNPGEFIVNNIPTGDTVITVNIETQECGTYTQTYTFNNTAGLTFSLTKNYV